jgi:heme exporter protein D
MSVWDGVLLAVAAFIAVTTLVRLMIARRNELLAQLRNEKLAEQQARQAEPQ